MSFIPIPISSIEKEVERPSLTYKLDLDKGRIVGKVDGLYAVEQAIRKALITPRFNCLVYGNQYGSEIKQRLIGGSVNTDYIEAAIPWLVKDCLKPDTRVLKVYDFKFEFIKGDAYISFTADTIFGKTKISEVIKNV